MLGATPWLPPEVEREPVQTPAPVDGVLAAQDVAFETVQASIEVDPTATDDGDADMLTTGVRTGAATATVVLALVDPVPFKQVMT